jgi:hypothetical protein
MVSNQDILGGTRKYLISVKTKHRNRLNIEAALMLAFTRIRPLFEVLGCHKQAQLSHEQVRTILQINEIFCHIILLY